MRKPYTTPANKSTSKNEKTSDPRIIRSPHDRQNPYVMINKNLMHDDSLSPLCRFFLMQLLAKPEDWDFRTSALQGEFSWLNEKKIHKFWRESIQAGYVKRVDVFDKGRRDDCIYYVAENPIYLDDSNNFARDSQKRNCENGSDILKNVSLLKKDNTESPPPKKPDKPKPKKQTPPAEAIIFSSIKIGEARLSKVDYDETIAKIGYDNFDYTVNEMREWLSKDKTRRFKSKNLKEKIITWNEDRLRKQKSPERRKAEERVKKVEEYNLNLIHQLTKHKYWEEHIEIYDKCIILTHKGRQNYHPWDPELGVVLEDLIKKRNES